MLAVFIYYRNVTDRQTDGQNCYINIGRQCAIKTRMMWLPDGEKNENLFTRFDRLHERDRQTDERTDGQTPRDGIGRAYA